MPTFSYKGYDFDVAHNPSQEEFAQMSAYVDTLPPKEAKAEPEKASLGTAVKSSVAGVGNTLDRAWSGLAGAIAPEKDAEDIYKNLDFRIKERDKWANPDNQELSLGGKIAGTVATLPAQILSAPLSAFETGQKLIESGESLPKALAGTAIDTVGNAAGMAIPGGVGSNLMKRAITGAGMNAAQDTAVKQAISSMSDTEEAKKMFAPTMDDAIVAGIVGGGFGAGTKGAAKGKANEGVNLKAIAKALEEPKDGSQMELFKDLPGPVAREGQDLGAGPLYEPQGRDRSQMELPLEDSPTLFVDDNGVATKALPDEATQLAKERADAQTPVREVEGTQADLFEPYTNSHREFDQFGNEQKALSFDEYAKTVDNLIQEKGTAYTPPEDLKTGYEQYLATTDEKQGGLFDAPSRQESFQEALYQDTVPQRTAEHPFVRKAEERVAKQEAMIEKMKADVEAGKIVPSILFRAEKDLAAFTAKAETARTNVQEALSKREELPKNERSFNARTRKQGGGLYIGASREERVLKNIPGLKEGLKNLLPDTRTNEEFIAQESKTGDVSQNLVQKGFNYLTKGGVYQTLKTNNPLIHRVVDRFLEADNNAKAITGELVHREYAPAARALNDKEKAQVWTAMTMAENAGKPLTREVLAEAGFNEKQMKYAELHQKVMDPLYEEMSKAMKAAGLEPVSKRVAYVASKARGDFRRFVYDKDGAIVGVLGNNTKWGLDADVKKLQAAMPGAKVGEQRYYGGTQSRNGTETGFNQMLEFLSQNDPRLKEFVDIVNEMGREDAFNYMNAKSHTMEKKGIWGTEGRKLFESAERNAIEGMEAQVRYAETMIKWGELSKAVEDTKAVMDKDNGLDMPNAKAYLKNYIDNALGRNPTEVGRALEGLTGAFGKATGVGVTIPAKAMTAAKSAVNGLLLGWGNVPFMVANIVQPFKTMPEMKAWLESKGANTTFDAGTGYSYMARALNDMMPGKKSPIVQQALDYAAKNHVYSSDLFESANTVKKDFEYYWNQGTQAGASHIEHWTRKNMFLSMVHLLHDNGLTPKDGLFQAARRATDMTMNNYSHQEAPIAYNAMGGAGRAAYNLASFKHNELSRLSLFARELGKEGNARPLLTALASQVAFAGIKGTIGYGAANMLVEEISEMLGKPTSLTKMLLDSDLSKYLKFGVFASAGLDMTSRLGLSEIFPDNVADLMFPGVSKLGNIAKAGFEAAKNPNEYNIKGAVREAAPLSMSGAMDRAWFSSKDAQGNELALNRNKVEASATRNEQDKLYKSFGASGLNETTQKTLAYENKKIDKIYQDKRSSVLDNVAKEFFTSGKVNQELIKKYVELQGDPATLDKELTNMGIKLKVPAHKLQLLKNASSQSITALRRAERQMGR